MKLLFDGTNYMYRSFHTQKEPTPEFVAYQTLNMVRTDMQRFNIQPNKDYVVFVIDAKGGSFRTRLYPLYKSNRMKEQRPEVMVEAQKIITKILRLWGIQVVSYRGVEADDVIGSIAIQSLDPVIICSGDKDFKQLIRNHISIWNGLKKILIDKERFIQEEGYLPKYFSTYLSLLGDKIDNVPGIKGIGPKTAHLLTKEYLTIDAIIASDSRVFNKFKTEDNISILKQAHSLIKIKLNIKHKCVPYTGVLDRLELIKAYKKYSFNKWLSELDTPSLF